MIFELSADQREIQSLAREFARLSSQTTSAAVDALLEEVAHVGSLRRWPEPSEPCHPAEFARQPDAWRRFPAFRLA